MELQEKQNKVDQNNDENSDFTATGLGKTHIPAKKQELLATNSSYTEENAEKSPNLSQNTVDFTQNPLTCVDNSTKIQQNQSNVDNSEENQVKIGENQENTRIFSPLELLFTKEGVAEFNTSFPTLDAEKLKKNKDFQAFISILTPNLSLSQVYSRFSALSASIEENAQKKLAQAIANASSGVGSLSSSESNGDVFFTKEQVLRMTPEQISKNYAKIRRSQEKW